MTATTDPLGALTSDQQQAFERDGFLCPIPVLGDAEASRYLGRYMEYISSNKERLTTLPPNQKYQVTSETHFVMKWVHEITSHPRVLDAVECLIGPNILAWNTNWFSKMPGEKTYVSWHQDGTYWNLVPPRVVTAWVALTPCGPTNGCMRVIPGTHTKPQIPQRETYAKDNALSRSQEIAVSIDERQAVDLVLQPGEMSLHHIWIVHGSNANTGTVPRIGIAIRYVRPEVVQESPGRPLAVLVRGHDTCGNFELLPSPTDDCTGPQSQAHLDIIERIRVSILKDADPAGRAASRTGQADA